MVESLAVLLVAWMGKSAWPHLVVAWNDRGWYNPSRYRKEVERLQADVDELTELLREYNDREKAKVSGLASAYKAKFNEDRISSIAERSGSFNE